MAGKTNGQIGVSSSIHEIAKRLLERGNNAYTGRAIARSALMPMRLDRRVGQVLGVCNLLHPDHRYAIECFLNSNVRHSRCRRRTVPMLMAWRTPDDVAGANFDNRAAFALGPADTVEDDQRLARRMGMPVRSRARFERHDGASRTARLFSLEGAVDADGAGEPGGGTLGGWSGAYFSPSWTAFQADRGRCFSVMVDGVSV